MRYNLRKITEISEGELQLPNGMDGIDIHISNVAGLENAGSEDLSFIYDPKYFDKFLNTKASVVLAPIDYKNKVNGLDVKFAIVWVKNPYKVFSNFLEILNKELNSQEHIIHPTAIVMQGAKIGNNVNIGPYSIIESGVELGNDVYISSNCHIGKESFVGNGTKIHSNVVIHSRTIIGSECVLHSGVVISSDGFGFLKDSEGINKKIPQIGIVRIGNFVEIGANSTIDRATLDETVVEDHVKIDNLVQIGHNVKIGSNTVIAAQTGIAGGTKIGKNCMIGGQVGFVGHIEIADGSQFGGKSGVSQSIKEPNKSYRGQPAQELKKQIKMEVELRRLPSNMEYVFAEIKRLEALLEDKKG